MAHTVYSQTDDLGRVVMRVDNEGLTEFPISGIAFTPSGGVARAFVNKTGAPTVRGTIVTTGSAYNSVIATTADVPNAMGVVWCKGKADGEICYVVSAGVADVLFEDGQGPTVGYWAGISANVGGRAQARASLPTNPATESTIHAGEIGHCLQTIGAGTDVVARVALHFN